jgi:hypothetical protein
MTMSRFKAQELSGKLDEKNHPWYPNAMKNVILKNMQCFLLLLALPALALAEEKSVEVKLDLTGYDDFTDIRRGFSTDEDDADFLKSELKNFLERRAGRYLPEGSRISIDFEDIDLAGDIEPQFFRGPTDVRIMRSVYPPRMEFDYEITSAAGDVLKQGSADEVGLGYLQWRPFLRTSSFDRYRYDKELLRRWLRGLELEQPIEEAR